MGDPNGNWSDLKWTAEKLSSEGICIVPLCENGKPMIDWKQTMKSEVSMTPIKKVLDCIDDGAKGLAISFESSIYGDLWCRTFDRHHDYMSSVTLMGQNAVPLAAAFKEKEKYHVLFLMDKFEDKDNFEEIASSRYRIEEPSGTIMGHYNLLRIPPTEGCKWIQEPVINLARPNVSNLYYYNPVLTGLLPPF
jgi:hypothetical protein